MRLLFAITVCSFCAVMWVALALARRIRRGHIVPLRPVPLPANRRLETQEFFEAGEFRTPRPLRLEQEIFQQRPRRPLAEIAFPSEAASAVTPRPVEATPFSGSAASASEIEKPRSPMPTPIRPATAYASLFGQNVPIARIEQNQSQPTRTRQHLRTDAPEVLPPDNDTAISQAAPLTAPMPFTLHRKPPQNARPSGLRRRIDLSHYTKDMGDLTDPYTNPLRGSGTQGPAPTGRTNR